MALWSCSCMDSARRGLTWSVYGGFWMCPAICALRFRRRRTRSLGWRARGAWWMVDFARAEKAMAEGPRSYATEVPPGMEDATDRIVQMIEAMQEALGVPSERLVIGGFSQGSMAACNAVFTRNVTPGGLVILSGTPVNIEAWKRGMVSKSGVPVFQSHGLHDPLLSFQAAEQLRDEMREAGLSTDWIPFRGGHEIPMPVLEGLGRFLSGT